MTNSTTTSRLKNALKCRLFTGNRCVNKIKNAAWLRPVGGIFCFFRLTKSREPIAKFAINSLALHCYFAETCSSPQSSPINQIRALIAKSAISVLIPTTALSKRALIPSFFRLTKSREPIAKFAINSLDSVNPRKLPGDESTLMRSLIIRYTIVFTCQLSRQPNIDWHQVTVRPKVCWVWFIRIYCILYQKVLDLRQILCQT